MKILAIETSCDETAAAVVEDGRKVLSSTVASQIDEHIKYGGVVPEIASRMHSECITAIVRAALYKAELTLTDIDAIAVTFAPGLIGALLVGVNYAKGLSYSSGLPLIPVHHLRAHIAANYISSPDLKPPFLALVVSGGHSHLVEVKDYTEFKILGRTRDDAAGEALDKTARAMGFPYPGGANMDKSCKDGNPNAFALPRPHVEGSPLDFSFSGLKTAVLNIINNANQKGEKINYEDLGASVMARVADCLVENTLGAAKLSGLKEIVLAGGVAANSVLRNKITKMCSENNFELFIPPLSLCGDNAAMIGSQGFYEFLAGKKADLNLNAFATMDIDF